MYYNGICISLCLIVYYTYSYVCRYKVFICFKSFSVIFKCLIISCIFKIQISCLKIRQYKFTVYIYCFLIIFKCFIIYFSLEKKITEFIISCIKIRIFIQCFFKFNFGKFIITFFSFKSPE